MIVCSFPFHHLVPFRFLLSLLLLSEPWVVPLPLPCGLHRGNIPLALRQSRSGPLANNTPLTGYEPNILDGFHYSKTVEIFLQEQSRDTTPSYLHGGTQWRDHRQSALFFTVHSEEVEMVASVDDLKSSLSIKDLTVQTSSSSTRKLLQHYTESSRMPFQEKGQSGGNESSNRRPLSPRKIDRLPDLRVLPGHWSQWFCRELCRPFYSCSQEWWYSGIRFEMGRNLCFINDTNPTWWNLGRIVQIKNTRVWETHVRIGIAQYGVSSEESRTWLKTMVKRSTEQNLRMKNFEARNENYETSAVVKNQGTKQREQRSLGDCCQ